MIEEIQEFEGLYKAKENEPFFIDSKELIGIKCRRLEEGLYKESLSELLDITSKQKLCSEDIVDALKLYEAIKALDKEESNNLSLKVVRSHIYSLKTRLGALEKKRHILEVSELDLSLVDMVSKGFNQEIKRLSAIEKDFVERERKEEATEAPKSQIEPENELPQKQIKDEIRELPKEIPKDADYYKAKRIHEFFSLYNDNTSFEVVLDSIKRGDTSDLIDRINGLRDKYMIDKTYIDSLLEGLIIREKIKKPISKEYVLEVFDQNNNVLDKASFSYGNFLNAVEHYKNASGFKRLLLRDDEDIILVEQ